MKRWMEMAARLYPRSWRERYGVEFQALLEDVKPGWRGFFNVVGGALQMQFRMNGTAYGKMAAVCAVVGALAAVAASFGMEKNYASSAVLRVVAPPTESAAETATNLDAAASVILSQANLVAIIIDPRLNLYAKERAQYLPVSDIADRMARDIRVAAMASPRAGQGQPFLISFAYRDPKKAQAVVQRLAMEFQDMASRENQMRDRMWKVVRAQSTPPAGEEIQVLEVANLPQQSTTIGGLKFALWGLLAGAVAGLAIAFTLRGPRRLLQVALCATAGAILTFGASFLLPRTYTSEAQMRIRRPIVPPEGYNPANIAPEFQSLTQQVLNDPRLQSIVDRNQLRIRLFNPPVGFSVAYSHRDRMEAQRGVSRVIAAFEEAHMRRERESLTTPEQRQILETHLGLSYQTLDMASLPELPDRDLRLPLVAAGMVLGILCGIVLSRRQVSDSPQAV